MTCSERELAAGQRAEVTYQGVIDGYSGTGENRYVRMRRDDAAMTTHLVNQVTVTALAPQGWPPQEGDVWEAGGRRWLARTRSGDGVLIMCPPAGMMITLPRFREDNPDAKLVLR